MSSSQAVQTAPPPVDVESAAERVELPAGEKLSLEQMTRIMDVAATLRRERSVAEQQLNLDQTKAKLRERLLEAARVSGDPVTEAEVDAAIEQYYERLHEFRPPASGFRSFLAHLWVLRGAILKTLFGVAAAFLVIWGLLSSGMLPGAARNRMMFERIERDAAAVEQVSQDTAIDRELATLVDSARAAQQQGDAAKLTEIAAKIAGVQAELEAQYTLVIASGPDVQSGVQRNWTDEAGTRTSGYFVLVEALGADGEPVQVQIENRETGKTELVSTWGEQVPEEVFNRLAADKQADGVLDEKLFGEKVRGERTVEVQLQDAAGAPLPRGGQITAW